MMTTVLTLQVSWEDLGEPWGGEGVQGPNFENCWSRLDYSKACQAFQMVSFLAYEEMKSH